MRAPRKPVCAATHTVPYGYYRSLPALGFNEELACWVAASAEAVEAVLDNAHCRVRPPPEPVPRAIADGPAGEVFRLLIRMNDGSGHAAMKLAVSRALSSV